MDHESAKADFSDYYDRLLSGERVLSLEEHLKECDECRTEWEHFESTMHKISGLGEASPSEEFAEHVTKELKRRGLLKFWNRQFYLTTRTALLSFILIAFLILLYLTYLFLLTPQEKPLKGGASVKERDGIHVIGPVDTKITTPTDKGDHW